MQGSTQRVITLFPAAILGQAYSEERRPKRGQTKGKGCSNQPSLYMNPPLQMRFKIRNSAPRLAAGNLTLHRRRHAHTLTRSTAI